MTKTLRLEKITGAKALERGRLLGITKSTIVFCRFLEHYIAKGRSGIYHGGEIWLYNSVSDLSELTGYHRSTVCRLLRDAKEKNLIKYGRCRNGGKGNVNYYTLNLEEYKIQIQNKLDIEAFKQKARVNAERNSLKQPGSFYLVYDGYKNVNGGCEEEPINKVNNRVYEIIEAEREEKKRRMREQGVISMREAYRQIALSNIKKHGGEFEPVKVSPVVEYVTAEEKEAIMTKSQGMNVCETSSPFENGCDLMDKLMNCMKVNVSERRLPRCGNLTQVKEEFDAEFRPDTIKKRDPEVNVKKMQMSEEEINVLREEKLQTWNCLRAGAGATTEVRKEARKEEPTEEVNEVDNEEVNEVTTLYYTRVKEPEDKPRDTENVYNLKEFINIKKEPGRNSKPVETEDYQEERINRKEKVNASGEETQELRSDEVGMSATEVKQREKEERANKGDPVYDGGEATEGGEATDDCEIKKINKINKNYEEMGKEPLGKEPLGKELNEQRDKETTTYRTLGEIRAKLASVLGENNTWVLKHTDQVKVMIKDKKLLKMQILERGFIRDKLQAKVEDLINAGILWEDKTVNDDNYKDMWL